MKNVFLNKSMNVAVKFIMLKNDIMEGKQK